ncbi:hypothetical protein NEDG_02085 [Nematocida displodere]|uniref:Uncharacterized protein n=1 Tax=Nematocida displodere TaxID=1805483 RepID=A0A177EKE0_9MICR|nr:hypothetical protein NEDG_02085 [Nematocida displodere]
MGQTVLNTALSLLLLSVSPMLAFSGSVSINHELATENTSVGYLYNLASGMYVGSYKSLDAFNTYTQGPRGSLLRTMGVVDKYSAIRLSLHKESSGSESLVTFVVDSNTPPLALYDTTDSDDGFYDPSFRRFDTLPMLQVVGNKLYAGIRKHTEAPKMFVLVPNTLDYAHKTFMIKSATRGYYMRARGTSGELVIATRATCTSSPYRDQCLFSWVPGFSVSKLLNDPIRMQDAQSILTGASDDEEWV